MYLRDCVTLKTDKTTNIQERQLIVDLWQIPVKNQIEIKCTKICTVSPVSSFRNTEQFSLEMNNQ